MINNSRDGIPVRETNKPSHNLADAKSKQSTEKQGKEDKGAGKQGTKNDYRLYPNPNMGKFTVEVHYKDISDITIRTFTPDGKIMSIWSGQNQSSYRYEGEVSTTGQYLIEIEGGGERKSLKMIVQ